MKKYFDATSFIDSYNGAVGALVAILTGVFGTYWFIFAAYLFFNVADWLTGWYRSKTKGEESSKVGLHGIIKKLGYWLIILVAFLVAHVFVLMGQMALGINLDFLHMIGWFTLAMLMVNEVRSILENLVQTGYNVPQFLISGLAVAQEIVEKAAEKATATDDEEETEK